MLPWMDTMRISPEQGTHRVSYLFHNERPEKRPTRQTFLDPTTNRGAWKVCATGAGSVRMWWASPGPGGVRCEPQPRT